MDMGKIVGKRELIVCTTVLVFFLKIRRKIIDNKQTVTLAGYGGPSPRSWKSRC